MKKTNKIDFIIFSFGILVIAISTIYLIRQYFMGNNFDLKGLILYILASLYLGMNSICLIVSKTWWKKHLVKISLIVTVVLSVYLMLFGLGVI